MVKYRGQDDKRRLMNHPLIIPAFLASAAIGYFVSDQQTASHSLLQSAVSPSCAIKGNISVNSGEQIYHIPGQKYYEETRISVGKGERWFCSEEEAREAGWRKSRL